MIRLLTLSGDSDMRDKRVQTRYVDGGAATNIQIAKGAARVHWISVFPQAVATVGVITIYDGMDAGGTKKYAMETGIVHQSIFSEPVPVRQGIFIAADANIGGYTVCWNPEPPSEMEA